MGAPNKMIKKEAWLLRGLSVYVEVSKPKVASLLVFSGVISQVIALKMRLGRVSPLGLHPLEIFAITTIALSLGVLGANAITCYIDRELDGLMERTRGRPLPSGKIAPPERALCYGIILCSIGMAMLLAVNVYAWLWSAVGLIDSTLVYNFLSKRRTVWNIVLGAPAGGTPVMAGWAAVTGDFLHPVPLLLAALIVLWTPAHIWSLAMRYSGDYQKAQVPMLPIKIGLKPAARCIASTTLLLPVLSTLLGIIGDFQLGFYLVAHTLNIAIIFLSLTLFFKPSSENAWRLFKFTSPYLAVLLIAGAIFVS